MPTRAATMRELMRLAREKFGAGATRYKTREELVAALARDAAQHPPRASAPPAPRLSRPDAAAPAAKVELPLVTRDFFRDPQ